MKTAETGGGILIKYTLREGLGLKEKREEEEEEVKNGAIENN